MDRDPCQYQQEDSDTDSVQVNIPVGADNVGRIKDDGVVESQSGGLGF